MKKREARDLLLSNQACNVDASDMALATPLFHAIDNNDRDSVQALLNKEASCM